MFIVTYQLIGSKFVEFLLIYFFVNFFLFAAIEGVERY